MPDLLRFEWERAVAGHDIVLVREEFFEGLYPNAANKSWISIDVPDAAKEAFDKAGPVKGQCIGERDSAFLVARPGDVIRYEPLTKYPGLFMEFSELTKSQESVKNFADKYGLLRGSDGVELIELWYDQIDAFAEGTAEWKVAQRTSNFDKLTTVFEKQVESSVSVHFAPSADHSRPALYLKPTDLRMALWLQFAQAVSASPQLRRCLWCPTWFVFGSGTGRRKSAHYCSSTCQKAKWKADHEKEKADAR